MTEMMPAETLRGGEVGTPVAAASAPVIAAAAGPDQEAASAGGILASLRTGLASFTGAGAMVLANPQFADLLGLQFDRLKTRMEFSAVLDMMMEAPEFAGPDKLSFVAGQRSLDRANVSTMRWSRGDDVIVAVTSDPLPYGGWTLTVTDISPFAHAEHDAQRRAALLHSILDAIPHGICVYNADRRITMFNRAYTKVMSGAPVAIGDHLEAVVRRRAAAGEYGTGDVEEIAAQQLAFDVARPQLRKRRRPNGLTVDVRTTPLPDGGYISVVTDITQLTEAEAEVSRRAEEMAVMLSHIRHGVTLWGQDRRLVASNSLAAELLQQPPGMLTPGRTERELLDSMLSRGHFGKTVAGTERARVLSELDRSTPFQRQIETPADRVLDVRSDPTPGGGWVTTYTDVTEARVAEQELRRAKEAAEAANRAKSRFLATMSHELRTPLNAVIGFSDTLLREAAGASHPRIAEFAQQINDSGRHLLGLINIILDVARIEAGRFDLASDKVDIVRLVRAGVRQADPAAQAAEVTLTADLPGDLPAIRSDERRLQQVLNHLLSNAVKFTHAGGTVSVAVATAPNGGLILSVCDTGIGIHDDDLDRVFEPFTQLDSTLGRRFQGAGLGLYLSRALVAGLGGELVLRSTVGEGTAVEVHLPPDRLIADGPPASG